MFTLIFRADATIHDSPSDALMHILGLIGDAPIPSFHIFPTDT